MSALVMLPGLICDGRMFSAQAAAFPEAHAMPGFGRIDRLERMAERVLETAPARMALMGHSMGARVALEIWRRAPERIERLALVSTGVHEPKPGEAEKRHGLRDLGYAHDAQALVDAWLPPMVAPANRRTAILAPLARMCLDNGVEAFAAQNEALLHRPEVASLLPTISCPVLVAVGEEDIWSPPSQHEDIAARLPHGILRRIAGSGHMLPAEAPGALNAAIAQWLALPATKEPNSHHRFPERSMT